MTNKDKIFTWLIMALNRAIRTIAQTLLSMIGTAAVFSAVDWKYTLEASLFAGVISVLTSFVSLPEFDQINDYDYEDQTHGDRDDPEGAEEYDETDDKGGDDHD